MTGHDEDRDGLAAEYVLGLLGGGELAEAERLLASDMAFAASVAAWRTRLADLDATAMPGRAGEALWRRIAGSISPAPAAAAPRRWHGLWESLVFWRGISLATAVATAVLAVVIAATPQRTDQPAFVAVLTTDTGRPGAVMHAYTDGRVTLIPLEIAPIPEGRSLQLWSISTAAPAPVAIGLMDQVRTIRLDPGHLSPAQLRDRFAVSVEPAGGSPTGQPTGPVVLQGRMKPAE
jgi:anti-sigma-K factor RskA